MALEEWTRWAASESIDTTAFDRKLAARFPDGELYQRGIDGFVPLPDEAEAILAALRGALVTLPPRLLECVAKVTKDRGFRRAWRLLPLKLHPRWSQGFDEAIRLPRDRYFVIARETYLFALFALDAERPHGAIVSIDPEYREAGVPRVAFASFDELSAHVVEGAEDGVSSASDSIDCQAIAAITQWQRVA